MSIGPEFLHAPREQLKESLMEIKCELSTCVTLKCSTGIQIHTRIWSNILWKQGCNTMRRKETQTVLQFMEKVSYFLMTT